MADPQGLDDLEAELQRMEEELAALKGKKPEKKAKRPKEAPPPEGAPAETAAPKKRLAMPRFGKRDAPEAPTPPRLPEATTPSPPDAAAAPRAVPVEAAAVVEVAPDIAATPSGRWRHEGRTWVLQLAPKEPVHLRRVLDADGNVVSEEPAPPELFAARPPSALAEEPVPEAPPADKPLHSLAERLGSKRKKGFFRRKQGD